MATPEERLTLLESQVQILNRRQGKIWKRLIWFMNTIAGLSNNGLLPKNAANQLSRARNVAQAEQDND